MSEFDQLRDNCAGLTYSQLAEELIEAEREYKHRKQMANEAYERFQCIKRSIIPERMDAEDITSISVNTSAGKKQLVKIDNVGVKSIPDKKGELWQWLRDHDAHELITETVNSSTLAGFIREQMRTGQEVPHDLVEINMYSQVSMRKA